MYEFISPNALITKISQINRSDRWSVYFRLQELKISCWCPEDGTLWVKIDNGLNAVLLRSIVQQFASTRAELTDWLERCWSNEFGIRNTEFRNT